MEQESKKLNMNKQQKILVESLSVSRGYLTDWYQQSIDETQPPIWTDEHLDELFKDFYLIPKKH